MTFDKTAEWLKDISTKSGIKESLDYDGISLWWFYEFGLYHFIENQLEIKKNNNEAALKSGTSKIILKLVKYHAASRAITRSVSSKIITKRPKNRQSEDSSAYKILAVSYTNYWKNYPTPQKEGKRIDQDTMLGEIITTLQNKNFDVVGVDADYTSFFVDFKTMIEKSIQGKGLWRPVEFYLTLGIIKKVFKATKKYKVEWDKLKNNKRFIDSLNVDCDGFHLSALLNDYFDRLFKCMFFSNPIFSKILYIELMKRAIKVEKPDLVLLTCSYCQLGRAATIAGKLKDIPTLEIQHGDISHSSIGYLHAKDEISLDGSAKSSYCPIPDKTAVYGYYQKYVLTKVSAYPEDSVVVTGQPRYDFLCQTDNIYSREKFLSKYNINQNNKIILWTTQCHGISDDENVQNFETVFRTMQNLKDATLIIKQHPHEGKKYTRMIKNYLNMYKISVVIPPKSSDTYEQLFVCDLMITRHSTTAMEAIALNKPVIILNLSGEPDPVKYVKEGVALGVYDENDLKAAIEKLLNDDFELAKNRKRYIGKYLYKMDGEATERVVKLIENMIDNHKRE